MLSVRPLLKAKYDIGIGFVFMAVFTYVVIRYIKKELQQMEWNKNTPLNLSVCFCKAAPADSPQV